MSNILMSLNGVTERLDVYIDRLVLTGTKFRSTLDKGGSKILYINQITSIQFKTASSPWTDALGWLYFSIPGEKDMSPGIYGATTCDTAIVFKIKENENAIKVKNKIEELIARATTSSESQVSGADEILKYKNLLDQGIITQEEFDNKKKQILNI